MTADKSLRSDRRRQPRQGAQAIRRALAVLRILAAGREEGVHLAEVVRATGLTRPTVHRILYALIEEGIVERSDRSGRYAIGRQVPELALARQSPSPLLIAAEPSLARVSAALGDTLFLTVRTGFDTLCVARRIGFYPIRVLSIEVGARRPLGVSSAGVAILASMPALDARKVVTANEVRFENYRTDLPTVLAQIQAARARGYSLRDVGLVQGTKSLSAWIKRPDGQPVAAITLSTVRHRLNSRREAEVAEVLLAAARDVEAAIQAASGQGCACLVSHETLFRCERPLRSMTGHSRATSASPRRTELQMPWKAMLLSKIDGNVVIRAATAS